MELEKVPNVAALAEATVNLLRQGVGQSGCMRERLAVTYDIDPSGPSWSRFVNNHAWALVRLQAIGAIRKIATGRYELAQDLSPREALRDSATFPIPGDATAPLPPWARDMIARATFKNARRWQAAPFAEDDLRALWKSCGGRCMLTGHPFNETQIGTGRARRPYAPSLDRIEADHPYTRDNCRLVLQAVNFALNSWGDEVFEAVTEAAVAHRRRANG